MQRGRKKDFPSWISVLHFNQNVVEGVELILIPDKNK